MVDYNTIVLGASKISKANSILVFNTRSFDRYSNLIKINGSFLKDNPKILSKLSNVPTRSNIKDIVKVVLSLEDLSGKKLYSLINKLNIPDRVEFTWDISDNVANLVSADGFDIIVFLSEHKNPLGFTVLNKPQGDHISNRNESVYSIRRSYLTYKTRIIVSFGNKVVINGNTIKLLDSLVTEAKFDKKSLVGENLYDYTDVDRLLSEDSKETSYTSSLIKLINNPKTKYTYTDSSTSIIDSTDSVKTVKLGLLREGVMIRNLELYDSFQIGYLNGDIVMYMWSNTYYNHYLIVSLTGLQGNGRPKYYISEDTRLDSDHKIIGFCGNYLITEDGGIYNIFRRSWLEFKGSRYLVDFSDPSSKLYVTKTSQFANVQEAISNYDFLANVHINLGRVADGGYIKVIKKTGAWITLELKDLGGYVITNINTSIFIDSSELSKVLYLNDDCLLLGDGEGNFKLVDNPGYHRTDKLVNNLSAKNLMNNLENYSNEWLPSSNYSDYSKEDSKFYKGFLRLFRRNKLPSTNKFSIIATLGGIIYYKLSNRINFL